MRRNGLLREWLAYPGDVQRLVLSGTVRVQKGGCFSFFVFLVFFFFGFNAWKYIIFSNIYIPNILSDKNLPWFGTMFFFYFSKCSMVLLSVLFSCLIEGSLVIRLGQIFRFQFCMPRATTKLFPVTFLCLQLFCGPLSFVNSCAIIYFSFNPCKRGMKWRGNLFLLFYAHFK